MQMQGLLCVELHGPLPPPVLLALLPLSKGTVIFPGSALAHVCMRGMRPEVSQSASWQTSLCPSCPGKDVWWIRAVPWELHCPAWDLQARTQSPGIYPQKPGLQSG